MQELVTLPPHLVEKIRAILAADLEIPKDLRVDLQAGLDQPTPSDTGTSEPEQKPSKKDDGDDNVEISDEGDAAPTMVKPPTIDIAVLERLSRWVSSETTTEAMKNASLDPIEYGMIPLLSGTELYIPPSQLPHLPLLSSETGINPYLPSYLSPLPPSFGQEYRSLTRQLSTVLNILFSIFGSAFAVYVAATTGGGYSREKGILLGVLAGVVVGVADGVLVWIFGQRVKESREEGRKLAMKLAKGSGGEGFKAKEGPGGEAMLELEGPVGVAIGEKAKEEPLVDMPEKAAEPIKKDIRLRRRAIGDKANKA